MTKPELIKQISKRCGIEQYKVKACIEAFTEIFTETLVKGGKIKLSGLGVFDTIHTKECRRRNPSTDEPVLVPEKIKARFKVGDTLKRKLNNEE